jgi:hypothetical protein
MNNNFLGNVKYFAAFWRLPRFGWVVVVELNDRSVKGFCCKNVISAAVVADEFSGQEIEHFA